MRNLQLELQKLEEKLEVLIAEKTTKKYVQMVEDEISEILKLIAEQESTNEQNSVTL